MAGSRRRIDALQALLFSARASSHHEVLLALPYHVTQALWPVLPRLLPNIHHPEVLRLM